MEKVEKLLKLIEISLLSFVILGSFIIALFLKKIIFVLSFLAGSFLGLINFKTTKKESAQFIEKIKKILENSGNKADLQKAGYIFIGKIFLKLLATAIIMSLLVIKLKFSPIFILIGFGVIYIGLILLSLIIFWRKKEILI